MISISTPRFAGVPFSSDAPGSGRRSPRRSKPDVFLSRLAKKGLSLGDVHSQIDAIVRDAPGSLPQGSDAFGVGLPSLPQYWFRVPKKREAKGARKKLVLNPIKTGVERLSAALLPFASFGGIQVMPKASGHQPFSLRELTPGIRQELLTLKNGFRPEELNAWLPRFAYDFGSFSALCRQRGLMPPVSSQRVLMGFKAIEESYVEYLEQLGARPRHHFDGIRATLDKTPPKRWVADFHVPDNVFMSPKGFQLIDWVPVPPDQSVDLLARYHDHSMGGFVRALMGETIFTAPQAYLSSLLIRPPMQARAKQAIRRLRDHAELRP